MREIVISGADWQTPDDFYISLLAAIGAPRWHGHNLDALWDSLTGGDINQTNPPYRVRITGTAQMPKDCQALIIRFVALISDARAKGSAVEVVCEQ